MAARVFIAEASETIRDSLTRKFESAGYDVLTAGDGDEAIHLLNVNNVPKVIVTATDLPVKDGLDMTREIKKDIRLQNIPIIVIKDSKTDVQAFRELGVEEFLPKPLQIPELFNTIEILIKYGSRSRIQQQKKGPGLETLVVLLVILAVAFVSIMIIGVNNIPFFNK